MICEVNLPRVFGGASFGGGEIQPMRKAVLRSAGNVMNQRAASGALVCKAVSATCAACAVLMSALCDACSSGFIHNVISSRKYDAVPAQNTRNNTQHTSNPDQVCSHAIDWRKPSLMPCSAASSPESDPAPRPA